MTLYELYIGVSETYIDTKNRTKSIARLRHALALLGQPSTDVGTITTLDIDKAIRRLRQAGYKPGTINRYLAALSKAFSWAYDREVITRKPKIQMLPEGAGRLTYLTPDQSTKLIEYLDAIDPQVSIVTQVLLATGFRIQELLTRKPCHLTVDSSGGYWLALDTGETKNDASRAAWLTDSLGRSLTALMVVGLPSYRTILNRLSAASLGASLGIHVTPHVLRHTTATRLTTLGVPTSQVRDIMGHRSLATTLRYIHNQREDLRVQMAKLQQPSDLAMADESSHWTKPLEPLEPEGSIDTARRRPEPKRLCSPLRSHSATRPLAGPKGPDKP